jgi:hypothetical protein
MRIALMGGWFLSRRDGTIVARHEVPGCAVWTFLEGHVGEFHLVGHTANPWPEVA